MKAPKKAYSLVVVLLTLGLVTVALFCLLAFEEAGVKTSSDNIERRKMFYVCDGMTRIVADTLQGFMRTVTLPTGVAGETALRTYLESADVGGGPLLPNLVPDGFALVRSAQISNYAHVGDAVAVPTGAFAGLVGKEDKLRLLVEARRADGRFTCRTQQDLSLSQIGMFQIALWSALPRTSLYYYTLGTDSLFAVDGRMHTQGDLVIADAPVTGGGAGVVAVRTLTSAGRITGSSTASLTALVATSPAVLPPPPLLLSDAVTVLQGASVRTSAAGYTGWLESGDTPPSPLDGQPSDADWLAATQAAGAAVSDARQGVAPLTLPVPTSAANAEDPLRFLIEPVDRDAAVDDRQRHKFAYKADIRIIDGVWYLADAANRGHWPGTPIWSDHPGHKVASFPGIASIDVGQSDLKVSRGWTTTPTRFSPYGFALDGSGRGVVRGELNTTPSLGGGPWAVRYGTYSQGFAASPTVFGFFAASGSGIPPAPTDIGCSRTDPPPAGDIEIKKYFRDNDFFALSSSCGAPWTKTSQFLASARLGFQDPQLTVDKNAIGTGPLNPAAVDASVGNIAPLVFSVTGFQSALAATAPGELGSYFPAGRPFNGIVFISSRWPSMLSPNPPQPLFPIEPSPAGARRPPVPPQFVPGGVTVVLPPPFIGAATREMAPPKTTYPALPYPLCSDDLGGTPYDDPAFQVHACDAPYYDITYTAFGAHASYYNSVQVVDAVTVYSTTGGAGSGKELLTGGLTIATDLPAYLNGLSNRRVAAMPWVPFAIAADNVALLPSSYAEYDRPWWATHTERISSTNSKILANVAILTGVATTRGGGCTDAAGSCGDSVLSGVRSIANFSGPNSGIDVMGSVVVGYHSRYVNLLFPEANQEITTPALTSWPKYFRISFDPNLGTLAKQPPGTEALGITTVRQWDRD